MDEGSAEKLAISGAGGGGGAGAGAGAGGGGGGGGAFFLQPEVNATKATRTRAIQMTFHFRLNNMIFASRTFQEPLFSPDGRLVSPLCGELANPGTIGHHGVDLLRAAARRHKHQVPAIRRPTRVLIAAFAMGQLIEP